MKLIDDGQYKNDESVRYELYQIAGMYSGSCLRQLRVFNGNLLLGLEHFAKDETLDLDQEIQNIINKYHAHPGQQIASE